MLKHANIFLIIAGLTVTGFAYSGGETPGETPGKSAGKSGGPKDNPCAADLKQFCSEVKPGEGRIIKCMKEHESELSESCKSHAAKMKGHAQKGKQVCKEDAEKLCKDIKPGGGRIIECLKKSQDKLSEGCKAELEMLKGKKQPAPPAI